MKKGICLLLFLVFCCGYARASSVDSLEELTARIPNDTVKVRLLNKLSWELTMSNYLSRAKAYNQQALRLAKTLKDRRGEAKAINICGIIFQGESKYQEALRNYSLSLSINQEIGDIRETAFSYQSIGAIYSIQNNFAISSKNYLTALHLYERIRDTLGISYIYSNLGQNDMQAGNYQSAMRNFSYCLKFKQAIGLPKGLSIAHLDMGNAYLKLHQLPLALENYRKALQYSLTGPENMQAKCHIGLGAIYLEMKSFAQARQELNTGLAMLQRVGLSSNFAEIYEVMHRLDSAQGDWKNAYTRYKLFIRYTEELKEQANNRKLIEDQMNDAFKERVAKAKAEQDKKDFIAAEEVKHQRMIRDVSLLGLLCVLIFLVIALWQRRKMQQEKVKLEKEKKRSDTLLLNILPEEVAEELKETGKAAAKHYESVTVLFTDFVNFTGISEKMSPTELVAEIDHCFRAFDEIIGKYGLEKIKTIGDAYLAVSGLPVPDKEHAHKAAMAALEIREWIRRERATFQIRIGMNSGPVVAGIVGLKKFAYDIWGDTVNTAARMEQHSETGKINISGITYNLIGEQFLCTYRGKIAAKNKGEIDMYFIEALIENSKA